MNETGSAEHAALFADSSFDHENVLGLTEDPRPPGVKKLKGARDLYRIRAGDYRIVYSIDDHSRVVDIVRIRHRSKVYE